MKKNIYRSISVFIILTAVALFFTSCITPPPAQRRRNDRRRGRGQQEQPAPRGYTPTENIRAQIGDMCYTND